MEVEGILEKWDKKKKAGANQTATVRMSPMFGPEVVALYKTANEAYNPVFVIKPLEDADNLRLLVALDLKFIIGCGFLMTMICRR